MDGIAIHPTFILGEDNSMKPDLTQSMVSSAWNDMLDVLKERLHKVWSDAQVMIDFSFDDSYNNYLITVQIKRNWKRYSISDTREEFFKFLRDSGLFHYFEEGVRDDDVFALEDLGKKPERTEIEELCGEPEGSSESLVLVEKGLGEILNDEGELVIFLHEIRPDERYGKI